jgi:hypothetical protein
MEGNKKYVSTDKVLIKSFKAIGEFANEFEEVVAEKLSKIPKLLAIINIDSRKKIAI